MTSETRPQSPSEFPTDAETLRLIYLEGFESGKDGFQAKDNPYTAENSGGSIAYLAEWRRGFIDGSDVTRKFSKLAPDVRKRRREKLGIEGPDPE